MCKMLFVSFDIYFLRFLWEIFFGVITDNENLRSTAMVFRANMVLVVEARHN